MSIPAQCTTCGYRFTSRQIQITNSTDITIEGSEPCLKCGGRAVWQSGRYDFVGDAITSFQALSREQILGLKDIASRAASGTVSAASATQEAAAVNREAGELFRLAMQWGVPGLLFQLLAIWMQFAGDAADDARDGRTEALFRQQVAAQAEIIEQLVALNQSTATPEPRTYSPPAPHTSHKTPSEPSAEGRAGMRRAWKQEKKTSKDNSIKFRR